MTLIPVNQGIGMGAGMGNHWEQVHRNAGATLELHNMHGGGAHLMPCCLEPWEIVPMLRAAMATPAGCFVEVGVFWGGSAFHLTEAAKKQDRHVYLYDTFEGMPYMDKEDVAGVPVGVLKTNFDTVRGFLGTYPHIEKCVFPAEARVLPCEPIAFAHIDVDAYRSTKETTEALKPLMAPGGIMWFDDSNALEGARQAIRECFDTSLIDVDPATQRWYVRF